MRNDNNVLRENYCQMKKLVFLLLVKRNNNDVLAENYCQMKILLSVISEEK